MMKYLFKSTTGSFFRTIGRILAYILFGVLVAYIGGFLNIANVHASSKGTYFTVNEFVARYRDKMYNASAITSPPGFSEYSSYYFSEFSYDDVLTSPTRAEINITLEEDVYENKDYFYVYGFSSAFYVVGAFTTNSVCEVISYNPTQYPIDSPLSTTSYPFALKCDNGNLKTFTIHLQLQYNNMQQSANADKIYSIAPRFMFYKIIRYVTADSQQKIEQEIKEQNETLKGQLEEQKKLNDNITSSDITGATDDANSFFNNFEDEDYGFSDIIKMPLQFINNITSSSCTALNLPLPFVNKNVTLPCMSEVYSTYFGSFFTLYQTITFGMIAYWVCINLFRMVKNFKNPDNDEIEVFDL